jgi:hypothetical protein
MSFNSRPISCRRFCSTKVLQVPDRALATKRRERCQRLRPVWPEAQRSAKFDGRSILIAKTGEGIRQVVMGFRVVGPEFERASKRRDRVRELSGLYQRFSHRVLRFG